MVLLGNMIVNRTRIRFLRHLGIGLILFPDFVTTPFGVGLILVARYLSRETETAQDRRLREMVRYYLAHAGSSSDDADGTPSAPGSVKQQSTERLIPRQYSLSHSFQANLAPSVLHNWNDMRQRRARYTTDTHGLPQRHKAGDSLRVESRWADTSRSAEKMTHHTINMEQLSQRYEGKDGGVTHSNWGRNSGAGERVTPHTINMGSLSQHYNTGGVRQTKANYHSIDRTVLGQRYGSALRSSPTRNALRDNNHYYDIVSKKNVIGGYPCPVAYNVDPLVGTLKERKTVKGKREDCFYYRYAFGST